MNSFYIISYSLEYICTSGPESMPSHMTSVVSSQRRPLVTRHDDAAAWSDSLKTCLEATPSTPNRLEPGIYRTTEEGEDFLGQPIPTRRRSHSQAHPCLRWGRTHSHWRIFLCKFKTESSRRVTRKHENPQYARRLSALFRHLKLNPSITVTRRGSSNQSRISNDIAP